MKLINLTPHPVQIWDNDKLIVSIPPEEVPARLEENAVDCGFILTGTGGIRVKKVTYENVTGLPEPQKGVMYIVSIMVAMDLPSRTDLLVPYDLVRNEKGSIKGCRALMKLT